MAFCPQVATRCVASTLIEGNPMADLETGELAWELGILLAGPNATDLAAVPGCFEDLNTNPR